MSDSSTTSVTKTKVFVSALVLLALVAAAFFTILSGQKRSINNGGKDIHVVVPDPPLPHHSESVTTSEPTSSIRTTLIKHWPLSIAISVVLLVGIILAVVLPLLLEKPAPIVSEEDPEENVFVDDIDEPVIVQNNGSNLKKNIGIFLLVASVVGMVVVVVESVRAAKGRKGHQGNQDPQNNVKKSEPPVSPQVDPNANTNTNQNPPVNPNTNPNNNQRPQVNPRPSPIPPPVAITPKGPPVMNMQPGPSGPPPPNFFQQIPQQVNELVFGGPGDYRSFAPVCS